jgi:hypothetical protein
MKRAKEHLESVVRGPEQRMGRQHRQRRHRERQLVKRPKEQMTIRN